MRRRYFYWTYLVTALVLTIYGGYSFFYNYFKGKSIPLLGIIFFISGLVLLFLYLILFIISVIQKRNHKEEEKVTTDDEYKIDIEESTEEEEVEEEELKPVKNNTYRSDTTYERTSNYRSSGSRSYETIYIRKTGYGLVLRVTGPQILDMRTNIYYTIEGNIVNQNGSGPVFEISGNRIRSTFGSYLYEISGNNVNKTLGGFYASFSGNYLQIHDLSEKYEIDGDLSIKQKLAIVALLFGTY